MEFFRKHWLRSQKGFVPLIIIVIAIFVIGAGVGGFLLFKEGRTPSPPKVVPSQSQHSPPIVPGQNSLYDANHWELIKYQKIDHIMRPGTTPADVVLFPEKTGSIGLYLLRSKLQTSATGAEAPLYDLNFIVARGDKILYQFTTKVPIKHTNTSYTKEWSIFYDNENIEVKDVTNDWPRVSSDEIIFTAAGPAGASTYKSHIYILQYQPETDSFKDIAIDDFENTEVSGLTWFSHDSKNMALVADVGEYRGCHFCESLYEYKIYQWDSAKSSFVLTRTLMSKEKYSFATYPEMIVDAKQQMSVMK